jgi:hypothetical protein
VINEENAVESTVGPCHSCRLSPGGRSARGPMKKTPQNQRQTHVTACLSPGSRLCALRTAAPTWLSVYRGRDARRVRHFVAEGRPQPPTDQETTARLEARQRTRRTAAGWAISLLILLPSSLNLRGPIGENGAPPSASCTKGGSLSGASSSFR